jgi:hypothetical protein
VAIAGCGKRARGPSTVEDAGDQIQPDIIEGDIQ